MSDYNMKRIILFILCLFGLIDIHSQTLKVTLSHDKSKVDRSTSNGTATIFFDSNIDDLTVICTDEKPDEPIQKIGKKVWFIHVNVKEDMDLDGVCYRNFLLKSKSSAEYYLTTPEIGYNQVLYYTVVLPNQFAKTLTAEYLFTKGASHGVRISFGTRFGGYVSYKWGAYKKSGCNIAEVHEDYDITRSKELGYIRTSITGGLRLGLIQKDVCKIPFSMHLLVGGGYGEYGRQWSNPMLVDGSSYFYSDYIKGFDGEIALQLSLYDWLCASFGTELIVGNGKISVDYLIGLGVNFNFDKLAKLKKRK